MKNYGRILTGILLLTFVVCVSSVAAQSMTGPMNGEILSVDVDAAARTNVIYASHDGTPETFIPWPVTGDWEFNWTSGGVDFKGSFVFGDCKTITDAGSMGGVTHQIFYDFAHHIQGTGVWDAENRVMTYEILPEKRDDSRASTTAQSRDPECVKISGMFAGKACDAFMAASPGLEGITLTIHFNDELSRFAGEAVMVQYSGSGATKSESVLELEFEGSLNSR